MNYKISAGYKGDLWFVKVDNLIIKIFYSVLKAQKWIEKQENEEGEYNDTNAAS